MNTGEWIKFENFGKPDPNKIYMVVPAADEDGNSYIVLGSFDPEINTWINPDGYEIDNILYIMETPEIPDMTFFE